MECQPLKSRLVPGHHRAEPFPRGTVGPWKRWWCGGRPITRPYLLKGLPFPLVSCPHAKGREGSVSSTSDRSAAGANNLRHNPTKLQPRTQGYQLSSTARTSLPWGLVVHVGVWLLHPMIIIERMPTQHPASASCRLSILEEEVRLGRGHGGAAQFRHVGQASSLGSACGRQVVGGSADRCYITGD